MDAPALVAVVALGRSAPEGGAVTAVTWTRLDSRTHRVVIERTRRCSECEGAGGYCPVPWGIPARKLHLVRERWLRCWRCDGTGEVPA
jgi:hypothetical protein